jgi:hypothetical protein
MANTLMKRREEREIDLKTRKKELREEKHKFVKTRHKRRRSNIQ